MVHSLLKRKTFNTLNKIKCCFFLNCADAISKELIYFMQHQKCIHFFYKYFNLYLNSKKYTTKLEEEVKCII